MLYNILSYARHEFFSTKVPTFAFVGHVSKFCEVHPSPQHILAHAIIWSVASGAFMCTPGYGLNESSNAEVGQVISGQ